MKQTKKSRKNKSLLQGDVVIPGLKAISISPPLSLQAAAVPPPPLIYIDGTVAYMICQVVQILETHNDNNPDHYLLLGQIHGANVLSTYWDVQKNIFRPIITPSPHRKDANDTTTTNDHNCSNDPNDKPPPPYLTFFGAQTFGYVE